MMQSPTTASEPALTVSRDAGSEQSTASLVTAMVADVKRLGESYFELTRLEVTGTLRKALQLAGATVLAALGLVWLSASFALLLIDSGDLSRGGACAVVGGVLACLGAAWGVAITIHHSRHERGT